VLFRSAAKKKSEKDRRESERIETERKKIAEATRLAQEKIDAKEKRRQQYQKERDEEAANARQQRQTEIDKKIRTIKDEISERIRKIQLHSDELIQIEIKKNQEIQERLVEQEKQQKFDDRSSSFIAMTTTTESGDSYERMNLNIRRIKQDAAIQIKEINDEYDLKTIQLRATLNKYMKFGTREQVKEFAEENRAMINTRAQINQIGTMMKTLREQRKRVIISNLSSDEKRAKLDEIDLRITKQVETIGALRVKAGL
jgi:DNA gyrase/topoisomerase IV subunit A